MDLALIFAANSWLLFVSVFVFGLVVGSFLNVVILRYPETLKYEWQKECAEYNDVSFDKEKPPGLVASRSACPQCRNQLKAWHNIPVVSYLILKGRCGFCGKPIPIRYPIVELLTAVLSVLIAYAFGYGVQLLSGLFLLWLLVAISGIDLDTFLIPDQLSLFLLWLGLFLSLFGVFVSVEQAVVGALVGYLSLWSLFWLFKLATGKEGMGYGDFKLLSAGGAWLGPEKLIVVLVVASVSGLLFAITEKVLSKGGNKIPFGPYLSIGILVSLIWGEKILTWYLP